MPEHKEKRSWFRSGKVSREALDLRREEAEPLPPPPPMQVYMPEGINFDELWKDEEVPQGNFLHTLLLGVITFLCLVITITVFVK